MAESTASAMPEASSSSSSATASAASWSIVTHPTERDVVWNCRGELCTTTRLEAAVRVRTVVLQHADAYATANTLAAKKRLVQTVIFAVERDGGRFLLQTTSASCATSAPRYEPMDRRTTMRSVHQLLHAAARHLSPPEARQRMQLVASWRNANIHNTNNHDNHKSPNSISNHNRPTISRDGNEETNDRDNHRAKACPGDTAAAAAAPTANARQANPPHKEQVSMSETNEDTTLPPRTEMPDAEPSVAALSPLPPTPTRRRALSLVRRVWTWHQEVCQRLLAAASDNIGKRNGDATLGTAAVLQTTACRSSIGGLHPALPMETMVTLADRLFQTQAAFGAARKPTALDWGWHFTSPRRVRTIRQYGLLTRAECLARGIFPQQDDEDEDDAPSSFHGEALGPGVYTANAYSDSLPARFGRTGYLVLRLAGRTQQHHHRLGRAVAAMAPQRFGMDSIQNGNVVAVTTSSQVLPVMEFDFGITFGTNHRAPVPAWLCPVRIAQRTWETHLNQLVAEWTRPAGGNRDCTATRTRTDGADTSIVTPFINVPSRRSRSRHASSSSSSASFASPPPPPPPPPVACNSNRGMTTQPAPSTTILWQPRPRLSVVSNQIPLARLGQIVYNMPNTVSIVDDLPLESYCMVDKSKAATTSTGDDINASVACGREEHEGGGGEDACVICMMPLDASVARLKSCGHELHLTCLQEASKRKAQCPVCRSPFVGRTPRGYMPSGTMMVYKSSVICEGHAPAESFSIEYSFGSAIQASFHPNPGLHHSGTTRVAYLPDTPDGRRLLSRLQDAFRHGLTFGVGTSLTTGRSNVMTWVSIPHKTSYCGGVHGFPDPFYFTNCNEALDALHVRPAHSDELVEDDSAL